MRTPRLVVVLSLVLSCASCKKAAPPLEVATVVGLLAGCEHRARVGDLPGFRSCLTLGSAKALDGAFAQATARARQARDRVAPILRRAMESPPPVQQAVKPSLVAARRSSAQLAALERAATWPGQLQAVSSAPKSTVADLVLRGERATFKKVVGSVRTEHYLRVEGGTWKIDLAGGPELGRRLNRLGQEMNKAAQLLERDAAALGAALDRTSQPAAPAAPPRPGQSKH